jgi:hypothetical protein
VQMMVCRPVVAGLISRETSRRGRAGVRGGGARLKAATAAHRCFNRRGMKQRHCSDRCLMMLCGLSRAGQTRRTHRLRPNSAASWSAPY